VHNIAQWVGREITEEHPVLDARLPNGSRVHAIIPPSARGGTYVTIRKFARESYTLDDFLRFGSISPDAQEFLGLCVRLRKNMLIAGGTGTGKTALLGALSREIPEQERIIVIEDTAELRLIQTHCLYLEAKHADAAGRGALDVRQLFHNSLRMRPDRIIVGEVRGGEALDMVQSMLSGHGGSISTIHADSPRDALARLETLSLMSDVDIPVYVARAQVAAAIHLVVQLARFAEDGSRKVTRITEAVGLDRSNQFQLRDLFVSRMAGRDPGGRLTATLDATGVRPSFAHEAQEHGLESLIRLSQPLWSHDT
jgi:pilus assembly protein CpaF